MSRGPVAQHARVTVRPAVALDLEAIVRIERESFSEPWSRRSFAELLGARRVTFLVAVADAEVLGYSVMLTAADEAEIANLAVVRHARRHGVGRELLRAALDRARDLGIASVFLEVRFSNAAAQSLYHSAGFREVSRRAQYYRQPVEDAVVMKKTMTDGG
jgi:ribosomal-protein-alanine N-acetyltransferase